MRVALISDIHANEVALEAVFQDIARAGVDLTVCLGDVATLGPRPGEVLAMLQDRGCPCILGNHDDFLLQPALIGEYTEAPIIVDAVNWCRDQLTPGAVTFLGTFREGMEIDLGEDRTLRLFHGSPRSHMEDVLATTPADALDALLNGHGATVMAGGHTHLQMVRQHRGMLLVNPGSVGLPFEQHISAGPPKVLPHAEYAIVGCDAGDVNVTLRRVQLDKRKLQSAARQWEHPLAGTLVSQYA